MVPSGLRLCSRSWSAPASPLAAVDGSAERAGFDASSDPGLAYARRFRSLAFDEAAAAHLARIVVALRRAERRVNAYDAVIAATAASRGLAVWTQDADHEVIAEVAGDLVVIRG